MQQLPVSTTATRYYTTYIRGRPNVLPIIVSHGKQSVLPAKGKGKNSLTDSLLGTCQVVFHVSGQSANRVEYFDIVPNDVVTMAGQVMSGCVSGASNGGMVTKKLRKTTDALGSGEYKLFPDPALREMVVFPSPTAVLLTRS